MWTLFVLNILIVLLYTTWCVQGLMTSGAGDHWPLFIAPGHRQCQWPQHRPTVSCENMSNISIWNEMSCDLPLHCFLAIVDHITSQQHFTGNPTSSTATEQQRLDATKLLVTFSEFSVKSGGYMEGTVDTVVGSVQHLLNSVFPS